ncbi:hypothetical protein PV327_007344 [Microctonus hyperodae]|uniref:Odorant receptor n=1 Tax=Microctonus hyperodae TaxID=165561 RepID=A0AA39FZA9_MICHY|nr:hypothetical protein PV327_007344 [Microctonus hyperodae]
MADDPMIKYYIFRKSIENMLFIIGLYPPRATSKFYRFIPYFNMFVQAYTVFGILCFMQLHIDNLLEVVSVTGILISNSISIVKTSCILMNLDDLLKLLKTNDEYFNTVAKSSRSKDLLKNFSTFWYLSWVLLISCVSLFMCATFPPMMQYIIDNIRHINNHNYRLPIKVVYRWLPRYEGISYVIHWILQTYGAVSIFLMTCSIQSNFCMLVFQMISEFRHMSYLHTHFDELNDKDSTVRYCINKYIMLLKYRDLIQNIFGPIILQMFISNALQLCVSLFILSQLRADPINILFFTAFVITKISESCICAFAGSQLISESEDFKHTVYSINWHGNKRLTCWVLMSLNQRPMTLIACHYTTISLNILVSIVNTTISYYFLLQTLQSD